MGTTTSIVIGPDDPDAPDVRRLVHIHVAFGRAHSPPADVHALDTTRLRDPAVSFFSARRDVTLLGIGALKRLDTDHAEIKSMHTAEAARGRGVARAMLNHLLKVAHDQRYRRVSLETGSMDAFYPARRLYESAGFVPCEPFADYPESPNSTYMTLRLDA